jgi:4-hydroxy-3-methylbut-2-enyl diphosphate reductase
MEILVASEIGFCFGVKRAVQLARDALKVGLPVATLGLLVHNEAVMAELFAAGIRQIHDLDEVETGMVITRAHGISEAIEHAARQRGLILINTCCPIVQKILRQGQAMHAAGRQVIIIGDEQHPEVQSLTENIPGSLVCATIGPAELGRLAQIHQPLAFLAQSTLTHETWSEVQRQMKIHFPESVAINTICPHTRQRILAAQTLAPQVAGMLVVGSFRSANTCQLTQTCQAIVPTQQIEGIADIPWDWLEARSKIGLISGTSTPLSLIQAIMAAIEAGRPVKRSN